MNPALDLETARANMVDQQIRPWRVLDARTLDALRRIRARISCRLTYATSRSPTCRFRCRAVTVMLVMRAR